MNHWVSFFLAFLFSCTSIYAQVNTEFHLQTKIGLVGDQLKDIPVNDMVPIIFDHNFKHGLSLAAGGSYQYAFKQRGGLSLGLLYEQGGFMRLTSYEFKEGQSFDRTGQITQHFVNKSLLLPLHYLLSYKKVGLAAGVITNVHLRSKLKGEHVAQEGGEEILRAQNTYVSGGFTREEWGGLAITSLERPISFQLAIGAYYKLTPRCRLEIEYKDFLGTKDLLVSEVKMPDFFGYGGTYTSTTSSTALAKSFTLGVSWRIR